MNHDKIEPGIYATPSGMTGQILFRHPWVMVKAFYAHFTSSYRCALSNPFRSRILYNQQYAVATSFVSPSEHCILPPSRASYTHTQITFLLACRRPSRAAQQHRPVLGDVHPQEHDPHLPRVLQRRGPQQVPPLPLTLTLGACPFGLFDARENGRKMKTVRSYKNRTAWLEPKYYLRFGSQSCLRNALPIL